MASFFHILIFFVIFLPTLLIALPPKLPTPAPQQKHQQSLTQDDLDRVIRNTDDKLVELAEHKGIPGFAAGIVYQGKIVHTKCFGFRSLKTKALITEDTVFQLGSVSKAVTSTLIGALLQKKAFHLDDKLTKYIPDFSYEPHTLTLKHVLTHTTGIPRFGFNALVESESKTREQMFDQLQRAQGTSTPGSRYDYHNVAYSLSIPVIESVTNKTLEEALNDNVFEPLGMTTASASLEGLLKHSNRAFPHQKTKNGYITCQSYRKGYYEIAPSGGINASITDMCKFLSAHMGYTPDVLNAQTLNILHTAYTPAKDVFEKNPSNINRFKGSYYGIGWRILDYEGHKILFHGGWVKGFINIALIIPSKQIGIVVLQNAETSFPWMGAMSFVDAVLGIEGRSWEKKAIAHRLMHAKKIKNTKHSPGYKNIAAKTHKAEKTPKIVGGKLLKKVATTPHTTSKKTAKKAVKLKKKNVSV